MTWVFGYGSLVWRPAFAHVQREHAFIDGYKRRFWQGSEDHRGVPGAPGRVVTLIPEIGARTWGTAYRLEPDSADEVLTQLDHRERGGYERRRVTMFSPTRSRIGEGLVYLATEENPNYLGPASVTEIATQIRGSTGPSGHNTEYVLRLADALREMGAEDEHVFALEIQLKSHK